ncbi:putative NBD/HSP70 family sugar kinase [Evansella vedderi]|uniref:NBD/HSP70 family sugar kinase n=1 Tax=Evansella vedderi TaxID=38282 RepID=A0ABT9ZXA6_9BACI|nr:ROK family protein [Evansella vedderi]MDQ0255861.1 putative NBD/HSP70 family sugar kinase [Evansella vedderi]
MNCLLTIDIGGTFTKFGLVSTEGELTERQQNPTPETLTQFLSLVEIYYHKHQNHYGIQGIAISCPGSVTESGKILGYSSVPFLHKENIRERVERYFQLPTTVENDANCVALGEMWNGAAKGMDTFACIVCGTGIGGSIVMNGKLHKGVNLHGGEFGYVLFSNTNEEFHTWSELGSSSALTRRLRQTAPYYENWTGPLVFENAEEHKEANESVALFFRTLAMGVFTIQYIIDPEKIIIGGGITRQESFMKELTAHLDVLFEAKPFAKVRPNVSVCQNLDNAQLFGAAHVWLEKYGRGVSIV